ncbi:Ig-like domain-containing protein, partial [uncultured Shewanella sp.]|uniref:Ig-like domain-containing protein n=1 Tax=uncultured Shewanella sp. TaxID=173975 RepID=UPI0026084A68
TAPEPTITVNHITADNIVNAAEEGRELHVTGHVGGEVNNGDTVTITLDGTLYTGTIFPAEEGPGYWYDIPVPGSAFVDAEPYHLDARIDTVDAAGNPGHANQG